MKDKLTNLKVEQKLKKAFTSVIRAFIIAILIAFAGIAMINANLNRFYNESYRNMELQLEIRKDIQLIDKNVLWAVSTVDETQKSKMDEAESYAQSVESNVLELESSFSDKEKTAALDSAWNTLNAERAKVLELAAAGSSAEALELFNGSYNEATQKIQNLLIEIGEAADAQAATAYSRASSLVTMVNIFMLVIAVFSVVLCMKSSKRVSNVMVAPINELQAAAQKLKAGDLDIEITYTSEDELGDLAQNFREACAEIKVVIEDMDYLLRGMADGNFDIHTQVADSYVGHFELLIASIRKMNRSLNGTLKQINYTAGQVMADSGQLAGNAQSLAEGATEQAGAVQELRATVGNIANIAEESAESSVMAATSAKTSAENAGKSREEINALTEAMERINETSREIENIIVAIEEIASQTNLLSLNASIEAARAGEAGRGFAVVADQIGKLASDSADSAVTTRELISKSLEEIEKGNQIVDHTMETISTVLESMEQFASTASNMADASKEQADMLKQIEDGIEQISAVVESNTAAAQETSAISQELSSQAQDLEQMIAAFEFRKD